MDQIDQNAAEIQGRAAADRLANEALLLLNVMRFPPERRARLTPDDRNRYIRHVLMAVAGLCGALVPMQDAMSMARPEADPCSRYTRLAIAIGEVLGVSEREVLDLVAGQFAEASDLQGGQSPA